MNEITEKTRSNGGTILVVEDERFMLRLLEKKLSRHGYRVLTAADGQEAIDLFRRHRENIDAVLLDLGLPKIGGWQVFQKMKEENPHVKVVVATGYLDPQLRTKLIQASTARLFYKPYHLDEIQRAFQDLIEKF